MSPDGRRAGGRGRGPGIGAILVVATACALHHLVGRSALGPGDLPVDAELLVRGAAVAVPPVLVAAVVRRRRPGRRTVGAAVVATAWNLQGLLLLGVVAREVGWWSFGVDTGAVAGLPVDLWVAWAVLWGAVPALLGAHHLSVVVAIAVAVDVVVMPLTDPVVHLGPWWLVGEVAAVATCLVPGVVLARWTARDEVLLGRVLLQAVGFTGLVAFVLPSLVFSLTGEGWAELIDRRWWVVVATALVLAPVAAMVAWAMVEFAVHGGTPMPLDPPKRLVVTGPYAYVANPMQLGVSVLLAAWGGLLGSGAVVAVGLVGAPLFSVTLASWSEAHDLRRRFDGRWEEYRREVRAWVPHRRPIGRGPGAGVGRAQAPVEVRR